MLEVGCELAVQLRKVQIHVTRTSSKNIRGTSELQTQTATEIAHANKCGQRVTMRSAMKCLDRAQAIMQLHRRVTQLTSFESCACDST